MRDFRQILLILTVTALPLFGLACGKGAPAGGVGPGVGVVQGDLVGMQTRWVASAYFDRAMDTTGSRFRVVSMTRLVERFGDAATDAVLLDCFDDYQGLLPVADIREHDLQLALELDIDPQFKRPGWLQPMLVIVPNGQDAPKQERFMTANIRALRFVKLADYYAPIANKLPQDEKVQAGFSFFTDNCLFCHALEGVGGNKGARLLSAFDYRKKSDRTKFEAAFKAFHSPDNPDKQNMEQFVSGGELENVAAFLAALQ
ncbi:putative Cytochrome c [Nitrospina gracilis 3/211]|uniref:Putative Cytochrome c n=1 Tax=Nitrospina gracilis (strain 3/211) TaxID=1266370 RepID=M1Z0T7_NITG3|nr:MULTISPECIES: c-type cytochrome [Nitrospina]MCF8724003.1 mono/diheme cytochrome c family protein [Nitrospina sp. Nb-3]CCQ91129.1 putative Cytochrome c [Nitrospina gracilis 3/211]